MGYKILIIDDEPIACQILKNYLTKNFNEFELEICHNAIEAFGKINTTKFDAMLLDINMKGITGIDFLKSLKNPPLTIFTTAYTEFAVQGFELNAVDYLLKPISEDRFVTSIQKVLAKLNSTFLPTSNIESSSNHLFVRSNKSWVKIELDKLWLVSGLKDYIQLYVGEDVITIYSTMTNFEEQLSKYSNFKRVHKSHIINLNFVEKLNSELITLKELDIKIGKTYKDNLNSIHLL